MDEKEMMVFIIMYTVLIIQIQWLTLTVQAMKPFTELHRKIYL